MAVTLKSDNIFEFHTKNLTIYTKSCPHRSPCIYHSIWHYPGRSYLTWASYMTRATQKLVIRESKGIHVPKHKRRRSLETDISHVMLSELSLMLTWCRDTVEARAWSTGNGNVHALNLGMTWALFTYPTTTCTKAKQCSGYFLPKTETLPQIC